MPQFTEFENATLSNWQTQVSKELKGDHADSLVWHTRLGFDMPAFVNAENAQKLSGSENERWPYTQGYYSEPRPWQIVESIVLHPDQIENCNQAALHALEHGATGLHIQCDPGSEANFMKFMEGILPEYISIWFSGEKQYVMARWLSHLALDRGIEAKQLTGGLLGDESLAIAQKDLPHMAQIMTLLPHFRCLWINAADLYDNGLSVVDEAAFALLAGKNTFQHYIQAGLAPDEIGQFIQFKFSSPLHYFVGIARQRAFRYCWSQIVAGFNPEHRCSAVAGIYTTTSYRHLSIRDVFNNMLRNTTASMSVILGGTDAHEVLPHDAAIEHEASNFSRRMARNIQLILAHECGLDQINDPAGGSYYIETLTALLAEAILKRYSEIESEKSWKAWTNGGIEVLIQKEQATLVEQIASGFIPVIGVNLYPNSKELQDPVLAKAIAQVKSRFRETGSFEEKAWSVKE